jgi:hypothetical protein
MHARRTRDKSFSGRTTGKLAPGMEFHHDFTGKNTWQTMASLLCLEVGFNKRALCEKLNI